MAVAATGTRSMGNKLNGASKPSVHSSNSHRRNPVGEREATVNSIAVLPNNHRRRSLISNDPIIVGSGEREDGADAVSASTAPERGAHRVACDTIVANPFSCLLCDARNNRSKGDSEENQNKLNADCCHVLEEENGLMNSCPSLTGMLHRPDQV